MELFYRFKKETDRPTEGQPITVDSIRKASERLLAFKDKKKVMDHTVVENEQWYKVRHWRYLQKGQGLTPSSAWLFNALTSKHADFMDNLPDATFLPRVQDDEAEADALTAILPVIMERNGWRECYSETVWQKLKHGTGVYSATWDNKADHGIGDIALSRVDILNFFCDPELQDIQDSSDVFVTKAMTKDQFKSLYPDVDGNLTGSIKPERFETDEKNSANDIVVVDWYYKVQRDGRTLLHFVKYVGDVILFASENEGATYADGFYWHGKYPFVVDTLYPLENSPFGFGLVAVGREPQAQIDQMNKLFLEHLAVGARPRTFISDSLGIKDEDFADLSKTIYRVKGSEITGKVYPIPHPSLDGIYYNIYASKIDELKETTSNRDVSNGSTSSGVTSGAAISALQETGNKTSRDMIGASYHAFEQLMKLVVELVRQFYTEPRYYRLTGQDGTPQYREYQNAGLNRPDRVPEFDIKIKTSYRKI